MKDAFGPLVSRVAPADFKGFLPYDGDADLAGDAEAYRDPGLGLGDTACI
jgi:hypothetical protein